jgi:hypothetical protein
MAGAVLPNLGPITGKWSPGDNGWSSAMNTNLRAIDDLVQCHVIDTTLAAPPAASDGAQYIVATNPTGVWAGHAGAIAHYDGASGSWTFYTPKAGWCVYSNAQAAYFIYKGSAWSNATASIITMPGYSRSPGGAITQWGSVTTAAGGTAPITFPLAFPSTCFIVIATVQSTTPTGKVASAGALSATGCTIAAADSTTGSGVAATVYWMAIGA